MIHPEQHYLDIFRVDVPRLDALIAEALRQGGDYCDLYFENTTGTAPSPPAAGTSTSA